MTLYRDDSSEILILDGFPCMETAFNELYGEKAIVS